MVANYAELLAIIESLTILKRENVLNKNIKIYTDSQYSINALTKWAMNWEKNNWKKKSKGEILNLEIIKSGYDLLKKYPNIKLEHVKGHSKSNDRLSIGNNEADRLATQSIKSYLKKEKNKTIQYYLTETRNEDLTPSAMTFNDVGLRTDHKWPGSAYDYSD